MTELKNIYYLLASAVLIVVVMIYGQFVLVPLVFSSLVAIAINPMICWLKSKIGSHLAAYILVISMIIGVLGGLLGLVYSEMTVVFSEFELDDINIDTVSDKVIGTLSEYSFMSMNLDDLFQNSAKEIMSFVTTGVQSILSSGGSMFYNLGMTLIFTYFISAYYTEIKSIIYADVDPDKKKRMQNIASQVPGVTRGYIKGMGIVMIILTILNSLAFLIIGLDYALLWGVIIGLLAFIPYLGSMVGLLLPLTYSVINSGGITQPLTILAVFLIIQQIEGNFLTPKIVGDRVNINPLLVIILMLIFGNLWGLMGIIISLPLAGIIRVVLDQYDDTKVLAELMSNKD